MQVLGSLVEWGWCQSAPVSGGAPEQPGKADGIQVSGAESEAESTSPTHDIQA